MIKGFVKEQCILIGPITPAQARKKWDNEIERQKTLKTEKLIGTQLFKHGKEPLRGGSANLYTIDFYHSYKKDMCDTVFSGEFVEYEDGCQIVGEISKSKGIKLFAWAFPLFMLLVCAALFLFYVDIWIVGCVLVGSLAVGVYSLKVDNYRVKMIMEYLQEFISRYDVNKEGIPDENN